MFSVRFYENWLPFVVEIAQRSRLFCCIVWLNDGPNVRRMLSNFCSWHLWLNKKMDDRYSVCARVLCSFFVMMNPPHRCCTLRNLTATFTYSNHSVSPLFAGSHLELAWLHAFLSCPDSCECQNGKTRESEAASGHSRVSWLHCGGKLIPEAWVFLHACSR